MRRQSLLFMATISTIVGLWLAAASAAKLPDLYTVAWLNEFSPAEVQPAGTLNLTWSVFNNGTMCLPGFPCDEEFGPAHGPWHEAAILSEDSKPDNRDILLGKITFNGILQPSEGHPMQTQFQIPPDCPPGSYNVIVYADYLAGHKDGQIAEADETNNWAACEDKLTVLPEPATLYVDADAPSDPGPNDPTISDPEENGSSDHPFDTIEEAIDASVSRGIVIVATGTYRGDGNRDLDFTGKAITVRSLDPNDPGIVAATIIDANGTWDDFHTGFVFLNDEGPDSVVAGLTITNGYGLKLAWGVDPVSQGGGVCCYAGSPTVLRCVIKANAAQAGGGIHCHNDTSPTIIDCIITENSASKGGGISCLYASPMVSGCTIAGNWASSGGGAVYDYGGKPTLKNCRFSGNSAAGHASSEGGGMRNSFGTVTLANCIFDGNLAYGRGGGMFNVKSTVTLSQCTFTGNHAGELGSTLYNSKSTAAATNCIFWDGPFGVHDGDDSATTVNYSDLQGTRPVQGNIDADPCFAKPGYWADRNDPNIVTEPGDPNAIWIGGDYHLKSQAGRWEPNSEAWVQDDVTSQCIDAGDISSPIGNEPFPNGGIVNMGAFGGTTEASKSYFGGPLCETITAGDINGDCKVDILDFALMAAHWLENKTLRP